MVTKDDVMIRCHKCHEFVRVNFTYAGGPDGNWWEGRCPNCQTKNLMCKPSWTKELSRKEKELEKLGRRL